MFNGFELREDEKKKPPEKPDFVGSKGELGGVVKRGLVKIACLSFIENLMKGKLLFANQPQGVVEGENTKMNMLIEKKYHPFCLKLRS